MQLHELNLILLKVNKSKKDFDIFIETGSYVGHTLNEIKSEFNKIISIEITEKYSNYCKQQFINNKNIEIIRGDSLLVLPDLINKYMNEKILFFLDAHCSAGDTGKNDMDVPLIEELKIIKKIYKNDGLIIIDDADLFELIDPWVSWVGINEKNILNALNGRINNYFYMTDIRSASKKRLIIILNKAID
jgi:hypothetical protein